MKKDAQQWLANTSTRLRAVKLSPSTVRTLSIVLLLISVCVLLLWKRRLLAGASMPTGSRGWKPFSEPTSAASSQTMTLLDATPVQTESLPEDFALQPGKNPGEYVGNDGREYCLPSTFGGFDLDPEVQARHNLETRIGVLEKTVEGLAVKATEGKTKP